MSAAIANTGFAFGDMRAGDISEIASIEAESYEFPWTAGIFRDCLKASYRCRVLRDAGGIVAYGILSAEGQEAHILNLCVRSPLQRCGYGRRMLAHLLEFAVAAGCRRVWLEVRRSNRPAVRLYRAAGFEHVGIRRGYYRAPGGREDALVLALGLDAGDPG
ncbi:ribosomal protein S18-alanine N-acetyltransferase [soil metagenome]